MTARQSITLLHTAQSNVALFEDALVALGLGDRLRLDHVVRPDLLRQVQTEGGLTEAVVGQTVDLLMTLADDAQGVLLTCSSLGPAAERRSSARVPVIRADAALASAAVSGGGRVAVLYAAPTSKDATGQLFSRAAQGTDARIDLRFVADAWDAFLAGDLSAYVTLIHEEMGRAERSGADRLALAQASMSPAGPGAGTGLPVLTVPGAALTALVRQLSQSAS